MFNERTNAAKSNASRSIAGIRVAMSQVSMVTRQQSHDRSRTPLDKRYLGIEWSIELLDFFPIY
jgi:hypothetical protein